MDLALHSSIAGLHRGPPAPNLEARRSVRHLCASLQKIRWVTAGLPSVCGHTAPRQRRVQTNQTECKRGDGDEPSSEGEENWRRKHLNDFLGVFSESEPSTSSSRTLCRRMPGSRTMKKGGLSVLRCRKGYKAEAPWSTSVSTHKIQRIRTQKRGESGDWAPVPVAGSKGGWVSVSICGGLSPSWRSKNPVGRVQRSGRSVREVVLGVVATEPVRCGHTVQHLRHWPGGVGGGVRGGVVTAHGNGRSGAALGVGRPFCRPVAPSVGALRHKRGMMRSDTVDGRPLMVPDWGFVPQPPLPNPVVCRHHGSQMGV